MDSFGMSIKEDLTNQQLKQKVLNLEAQLEIQKNISNKLKGGTLLKTEQIDYYPGEQLDMVLSILEQAMEKCDPDSRPYDILKSILSNNCKIGQGQYILNEVSKIFRNGDPVKQSDISKLENLGFRYITSKKHPKLRYQDKYQFVLASTPSDAKHGALNKLADISKCLAMKIKI